MHWGTSRAHCAALGARDLREKERERAKTEEIKRPNNPNLFIFCIIYRLREIYNSIPGNISFMHLLSV